MTVAQALAEAVPRLVAAGCDTPRLDAEVLLGHVLDAERTSLLIDRSRSIDPLQAARFRDLVGRRAEREPVAYIVGHKAFRRLDLLVDQRVLVPRPETEHLVEAALDLPHGARVVDVGTGCGAVALALADERPDLTILATDSSAAALAVARANGAKLGLEVQWLEGDLLAPVKDRVDAVLSNPPYVPDGAPLPPDVARFEPAEALYGGQDGLDVIRRLVAQSAQVAGLLAVEVGEGQAGSVAALAHEAGALSSIVARDLAGIERIIVARW